jgi:selenocysteine lyase/cysteine desulfurase
MPDLVLADQRSRFAVDDAVAYFNTAGLSPMLHAVRAAAIEALERRSKPWTISNTQWFGDVEELRSRIARLLGVTAGAVALVPSTSYGLAAVARNLTAGPGDRVLVLGEEFPSNQLTWRRFARRTGAELQVVRREAGQSWTDAILQVVDERVAVASVPNVHWTNGAVVELERVAPALRRAGSAFVIDASQSLGVMSLDVAALRPDAIVAVGYKWLLGPYSLGYLYLDPRLHDGEPLEENWIARAGSEDFSRLVNAMGEYRPGAQRFDVGERTNFQLTPMAAEALQQLLDWTVPRLAATLRVRTEAIAIRAERLGITVTRAQERAPHMFGIELPADAVQRVSLALSEANVIASVRGSSIRISPHLHNNQQDVDRLLEAVASAV